MGPAATPIPRQAWSVLIVSTLAFTVCFMVWTMFGVIGIPLKKTLGLNATEFGLLMATPVLTGSLIRVPLGIWTDKYGGRLVMTVLMTVTVPAIWLMSHATAYWHFLVIGLFVGLAACFSLPGGVLRAACCVLRAVGGVLSDKCGAHQVTWGVLWVSWICLFLLSNSQTEFTVPMINGPKSFHLGLNVVTFTALMFVPGPAWAFGKASIFKYIGNDHPQQTGAVSGIVGLAGDLGGFVLPFPFGALMAFNAIRSSAFMLMSRLVPYLLTGADPGELFLVRNVGAFVPPYDQSQGFHGTAAAIEFAVLSLKVQRIVVCGHSHCGAVRALQGSVPAAEQSAEQEADSGLGLSGVPCA